MMTIGELANQLAVTLTGNTGHTVQGLASLGEAGPEHVSFLSNERYLTDLANTRAGAVILHAKYAERCPTACLVADDPYLVFAHATVLFDDRPLAAVGIHPSAVVDDSATIDASASIGPHACIEAGVHVAAAAVIGAGSYIGRDSHIGTATHIQPNVTVYHQVHIGAHCIVHSSSVIGADGFGFAPGPHQGWQKIIQLGGVVVGDRVEIGACTTIDRGAMEPTVIEDGAIIDNLVQIAHNCHIGKNTAIAGCTGLAGSTTIGANCTLAGGVGVVGHLDICDGVHVTGMSMVTKSIDRPGSYSSGTPMMPTRDWKRSAVRFAQLERIQKRLAEVEKQQQ